jgi:hypothetical protein
MKLSSHRHADVSTVDTDLSTVSRDGVIRDVLRAAPYPLTVCLACIEVHRYSETNAIERARP